MSFSRIPEESSLAGPSVTALLALSSLWRRLMPCTALADGICLSRREIQERGDNCTNTGDKESMKFHRLG